MWWITVLSFGALGLMRVIQKICSKKTSLLVEPGVKFFHYGAFYQTLAAGVSLITLCIVGFHGFNTPTVLCALVCAVLLSVTLFSSIEAVKGCTLVLLNMCEAGSLVVPCILGIFLFDEPMGLWQWVGLTVFIVSAYFLASDSGSTNEKLNARTVLMLIVYFLSSGFLLVAQKYFAKLVPDGNTAMFSFLMFALNAVILFICMLVAQIAVAKKENARKILEIRPLDKKLYGFGAILAVAIFVVNMLMTTLAKTVDSVVLFSVESIIGIAATTAVGAIFFKEKITVKKILGITIGLAGIFLINAF